MKIKFMKSGRNRSIAIFIFIAFFSTNTHAKFFISNSAMYTAINADWDYQDKSDRFSGFNLSYGYTNLIKDKYTMSLFSNRYVSAEHTSKIQQNNNIYDKATKSTVDGIKLGYIIDISMISFDIYHVDLKNKIYDNDILIKKTNQSSIAFGSSYNIFLGESLSVGGFVVFPEEKIDLKYGLGANITYFF